MRSVKKAFENEVNEGSGVIPKILIREEKFGGVIIVAVVTILRERI